MMFFIGIFGVQDKDRTVRELDNVICKCGRYSRAALIEQYRYFHIFFIPVFKWNRRYFVQFRCCNRLFRVPDDYIDELMGGSDIDVNRLDELTWSGDNRCHVCGAVLDSAFSYCPYCGEKL